MPFEARLAFAGALGFVVTLVATPLAVRVALATNSLDHPGGRKGHAAATPYLGGTALLGGLAVAALALADGSVRFLPLLGGAVALWFVGTLDDRLGVPASLRLAVAVAGGALLWAEDLGWHTGVGAGADLALSCAWTGAVATAFNLLDNIDGAAGSVGAAAAAGVGSLAALGDDLVLAALAFGLCGACLGFLRYNLNSPARIFLGDGGSLPLGFVLAGSAMSLRLEGEGIVVAAAVALLLAAVPLLDTSFVVVSRLRRGVPVNTSGRDHITHRMLERLGSERAVAGALAAIQAVLSALAIALAQLG
ncbi:MAG: UDP-GlcNAc:undecaprenyl-phosphate/decaprenyl-phosphate GlcNAc-phosphate transferase [Thermoleophilaceae bacterium]|nr:UDP-GlcNAc:undecaprenyl-phosphate/decaprenyl-phosphate GlcNAc-phosphate transferase [Thermoleophilaceae bacterium]